MLNWDAIGALAELVGATAVIATLFYLARQVKHAAGQTKLGGVQAIQAANDRAYDPIYTPEISAIWTRGQENRECLSEQDRRLFDLLMARIVASYQSTVFQHERGAYDDELMKTLTDFVAKLLSDGGGRSWYDSELVLLSRSTRERLDERLGELDRGR